MKRDIEIRSKSKLSPNWKPLIMAELEHLKKMEMLELKEKGKAAEKAELWVILIGSNMSPIFKDFSNEARLEALKAFKETCYLNCEYDGRYLYLALSEAIEAANNQRKKEQAQNVSKDELSNEAQIIANWQKTHEMPQSHSKQQSNWESLPLGQKVTVCVFGLLAIAGSYFLISKIIGNSNPPSQGWTEGQADSQSERYKICYTQLDNGKIQDIETEADLGGKFRASWVNNKYLLQKVLNPSGRRYCGILEMNR